MDQFNEGLVARRKHYEEELAEAEQIYKHCFEEMQKYKSMIAAIDVLMAGGEPTNKTTSSPAPIEDEDSAEHGPFTPVRDYWRPILQVLVDLGGRGHRVKVMDMVGERMKDILLPADFGKLKTGHIRWRNRVAWQCSQMRSAAFGYIKNSSHRGIWEITETGRKWLDDKSN